MIEHVPELIEAGITSFKIEGRNKTAYYAACVTGAYRAAIDTYKRTRKTSFCRSSAAMRSIRSATASITPASTSAIRKTDSITATASISASTRLSACRSR